MSNIKNLYKENKGIMIILTIGICLIIILLIYKEVIIKNQYEREDISNNIEELSYQYKDNEYQNINISEETMVGIYYNYLKDLMINDQNTLWNLLNTNVRKRFNNDDLLFYEYINNKISKKTITNTVNKYSISNNNIYIEDSQNNKFSIKEKAVWDIEITGIN